MYLGKILSNQYVLRCRLSQYLFIESRDPFDHIDVREHYNFIQDLAKDGNKISVFLVQNGVGPCRKEAQSQEFLECIRSPNIEILADSLSLQERGMGGDDIHNEIRIATMDECTKILMSEGCKAIWH